MKPDRRPDSLLAAIAPLATEIVATRTRMTANLQRITRLRRSVLQQAFSGMVEDLAASLEPFREIEADLKSQG